MLGLFKKNKVSAPSSLNKIALNKFKKNKTGIFSVYFVIFSLLLAILGYLIVPDNTPYANQQILEISLSKPLSKHQFIKITQNKSPQKVSFLKRIISGKPENHNFIPITDYKIIGDSCTDITEEMKQKRLRDQRLKKWRESLKKEKEKG